MVSLSSSLLDLSDNDGGEHEYQEHPGDYSARMEELFTDQSEGDEASSPSHSPRSERIEVTKATYREQLRDVLGSETTGEYDETDDLDHSLSHGNVLSDDEQPTQSTSGPHQPVSPVHPDIHRNMLNTQILQVIHVEHAELEAALSDPLSSAPSTTFSPDRFASPLPTLPNTKTSFLHPTISRLRSSLIQQPSHPDSAATSDSHLSNEHSPESSHFSALSNDRPTVVQQEETSAKPKREVFQWTTLNSISNFVYSPKALKALKAMGAADLGIPTVIAANGLICIGTGTGFICVFDFKQNLKCICGTDAIGKLVCLCFLDNIITMHFFRRECWCCNIAGTVPRPHLGCFWSRLWPRPCIRFKKTRSSLPRSPTDVPSCRKGRTTGGPFPRGCDHEHWLRSRETYSYHHG